MRDIHRFQGYRLYIYIYVIYTYIVYVYETANAYVHAHIYIYICICFTRNSWSEPAKRRRWGWGDGWIFWFTSLKRQIGGDGVDGGGWMVYAFLRWDFCFVKNPLMPLLDDVFFWGMMMVFYPKFRASCLLASIQTWVNIKQDTWCARNWRTP